MANARHYVRVVCRNCALMTGAGALVTMPRKVGIGILGFIYAIAAYGIPAFGVAYAIASTGGTGLIKASLLIQFVAGTLLSVLAYCVVSNQSLKSGMRTCYGLIMVALFIFGGYTIVSSF